MHVFFYLIGAISILAKIGLIWLLSDLWNRANELEWDLFYAVHKHEQKMRQTFENFAGRN